MRILTYDVDDALILRYGHVIRELLHHYSSAYDWARADIHAEILQSIGLRRGIDEPECEHFNECLYDIVKET